MTRRILVECYSGGRADERPRRVFIDGRAHTVARLLGAATEESFDTGERAYRYSVLTEQGSILEIKRTADGDWHLLSERPSE